MVVPLEFPHRFIAKEYTEYSIQELSAITNVEPAAKGRTPCRSSDDFVVLDGPEPETRSVPARFCKEHTEYSAEELALLLGGGCRRNLTSDDFDVPSTEHATVTTASPDGERPHGLCKELTEYSARELELLSELPAYGPGPSELRSSSDDFEAKESQAAPGRFLSWYHQSCLVPTDGAIKRSRRVYHNRRKTAWTDYDEEPTVAQVASSAAGGQQPSHLVDFLKSETAAASREAVRSAALDAAAQLGGGADGLAAALELRGPCGWTPLLVAVQRRQEAAVAALLELGAGPEGREPSCGWTPLMYAAGNGSLAIVQHLLQHKASVNALATRNNWTPLCSAIQSGKVAVVRALLDAGADYQLVRKHHPAVAEAYVQEFEPFFNQPPKRETAPSATWVRDASLYC